MKTKLNKIGMTVVATVMFAATLFLSMEKNDQGQWQFSAATASASGSEGGSENPAILGEDDYEICDIAHHKWVFESETVVTSLGSVLNNIVEGTLRHIFTLTSQRIVDGKIEYTYTRRTEQLVPTYNITCPGWVGLCSVKFCVTVGH